MKSLHDKIFDSFIIQNYERPPTPTPHLQNLRAGPQRIQRDVILQERSKSEIYHLEKIRGTRMKKFNDAMDQYRSYIKKENELIDRNFRHCEQRNKWYTE
jgi:hypothetical protein